MWWRLKSLASRLFPQPFVRARIKENIKAPRHSLEFVCVCVCVCVCVWGGGGGGGGGGGIQRWPVNTPHKGPVMRKMLPFDDVIMFNFSVAQWTVIYKPCVAGGSMRFFWFGVHVDHYKSRPPDIPWLAGMAFISSIILSLQSLTFP